MIKLQRQNKEIISAIRKHKKKAIELCEDVKKLQESIAKSRALLLELQEKQKNHEELKEEHLKHQEILQELLNQQTIEDPTNKTLLESSITKAVESSKLLEEKLGALQSEIDTKSHEITVKAAENKKLAEKISAAAQCENAAIGSDESEVDLGMELFGKQRLTTETDGSAGEGVDEYQIKIEEMMSKLKATEDELLKM